MLNLTEITTTLDLAAEVAATFDTIDYDYVWRDTDNERVWLTRPDGHIMEIQLAPNDVEGGVDLLYTTSTSREGLDEGDYDTQDGCPLNEVENTITTWANS